MRLLFGLAALLAASAAQAADQVVNVFKAPAANIMLVSAAYGSYPAVISFEGIIGLREPANLADFVAASNLKDGRVVIFFKGPGGLADTSVDIGQFIRRHQFDTAVEDKKYCTSGCALAWLGGARRFLGKDSHVGFHSAVDNFPTAGMSGRSTATRGSPIIWWGSATPRGSPTTSARLTPRP